MTEDIHNVVYQNAGMAGIDLSAGRVDAVAAARERTAAVMARLLRLDYGQTEPAPRFFTPPPAKS